MTIRSRKHWRQKREQETGVSYVEALVVLPIFLILFFGFVMLGTMLVARSQAQQVARANAFLAADNNCEGGVGNIVDDIDEDKSVPGDGGEGRRATDSAAVLKDQKEFGIFSGLIDALFGQSVETVGIARYPIPGLFGGGQGGTSATFPVTCNSERHTVFGFLGDLFLEITGL